MNRFRQWKRWSLVAVLIGSAAYVVGITVGRSVANDTREILLPIWPSLMSMHAEDRVVLVVGAVKCRLTLLAKPTSRDEVFACLQRGASAHEKDHPGSGFETRLKRLIEEAEPKPTEQVSAKARQAL